MKNQINMTEGPIFSKLLQFSIPLVFSSILQLLFNAADVIVVGRFAGDNSLAAVGSTGSLVNLLVNLFIGLSVGTNVVAARNFGAQKKDAVRETVHTAMLLSIFSGLFLSAVGVLSVKQILILMQSPEEVLDLAALYLQIYFGGITASMVYNFGSALLRAKGDTKRPMFILIAAGIINLVLNLIFVIPLKMDVAGVALATIISQLFSAVLVVIILVKETDEFHLNLKKLRINKAILLSIIRIGVPAGFQGIMFSFSNVIIQSSVNSFGAVMIAGSSASSNLDGFVYTSMNSFSQGALTFCSQNAGAGKYDRIKKTVFISQLTVIIVGVVMGYTGLFFGRRLLSFYSQSPEVIEAGFIRMKIIFSTYFLCGMMDVMASSIRGTGYSVLPVIVTLIGSCLLRIVWLATVFQIPEFHLPGTIFVSYPISWGITFAAHFVCFLIIMKKIQKQQEEKIF